MAILTADDAFKQYHNSKRWRVLKSGAVEVEGEGVIRTRGEPVTARIFFEKHGAAAREASQRFEIPLSWIFGMAAIEATRYRGTYDLNVRSLRFEKDYVSDLKTPNEISPGMMQTLISTAASMNAKFRLKLDVTREGLFDPRTSIMLGTAYMRDRADHYKKGVDTGRVLSGEKILDPFDFCYCIAAYNAGAVRLNSSPDYPFKMRTFSPNRTDKGLRYHNDAVAFLAQHGAC